MHEAVATEHIPRLQTIGRTVQVSHTVARFLNQEGTRHEIPTTQVVAKVGRQATGGNPGRRQGAAGNHAQAATFAIESGNAPHRGGKSIGIGRTTRIDNGILDLRNARGHAQGRTVTGVALAPDRLQRPIAARGRGKRPWTGGR